MRAPLLRTFAIVVGLYLVLALVQQGWFSLRTPINLLNGGAVLGLAALGQTFVIATGGIDLSVGAAVGLTSTVVASAITAGVPAAVALPLGTLLGLAVGALLGFAIWARGMPPFLVTLAAMLGMRGLAQLVHEGSFVIRDADHARVQALGVPVVEGLVLAPSACVWLLASSCGAFFLARTRLGRDLLAIGGDAKAAILLGVSPCRALVLAYALCGACAATAGAVFTLDTSAGNPNAALGLELDAIAAAVIGGAALQGGSASPLGTLLGVLLLGMIQTAITFDGRLGSGWTRIAVGGLLLAFVAAQRLGRVRSSAFQGR